MLSAAADVVSTDVVVGGLSGLAVSVERIAAIAAAELDAVLTSAAVLWPVIVDSDAPAAAMAHASAQASGLPAADNYSPDSHPAVLSSGHSMNHPPPELSAETLHWTPLDSAPGHGVDSAAQRRSHPS